MIFAAGPAEIKNIKLFFFAWYDNLSSKEILNMSQFSIKWSGTGKNL